MSDQSSAELEREAEAARARVSDTAESIRQKLSAGQLIDEFSELFAGGDLTGGLRNLKSQARENPLPIVLVGLGLAWLAFGKRTSSEHERAPSPGGDFMASSESLVSSMTSGAASVASRAADGVASTAAHLKDGMLSVAQAPQGISNAATKYIDQEPLLLAAVGLVFGTAVGALLPTTALETEQLGPQAERLRDEAKAILDKGLESAGNVASETYDSIKEEADRQGFAPSNDKTAAERVGEVVKTAAHTAKDAARRELGSETSGGAGT
jgi:ElaB/YqjD/DUF883 family membrane-anchored ribosome-binding protein